jgi:hypothetical protein
LKWISQQHVRRFDWQRDVLETGVGDQAPFERPVGPGEYDPTARVALPQLCRDCQARRQMASCASACE